ncbi:MAG: hypothetical protein ACT4PJ_11910 [Gemmatimonadaceae bacterium]
MDSVTYRTLAIALAVPALSGCGTLREMFPSREEVFKPIPITIGAPRVVGEDTVYVLQSAEYELIAPMRELLPDARKALDHTAREYRRVFGDEPQRIVVELRPVSRDRVADGWIPDTVEPAEGPRRAVAPAIVSDKRNRTPVAPAQFLMMRAARAWILARADFRVGRLPAAPLPAARFGDDARIPDWIEDALTDLIGGSPWQELYVARLADDVDRVALRDLLESARPEPVKDAQRRAQLPPTSTTRPAGGVFMGGPPSRDRGKLEGAELFRAQSVSFALFLAEHEGREYLGTLTDRLLSGEASVTALAAAPTLPDDLPAIEKAWKDWMRKIASR